MYINDDPNFQFLDLLYHFVDFVRLLLNCIMFKFITNKPAMASGGKKYAVDMG